MSYYKNNNEIKLCTKIDIKSKLWFMTKNTIVSWGKL